MVRDIKVHTFQILPPKKNVCQECAANHGIDEPHNRGSLFYQFKFHIEHDRLPTWDDALSHCSDIVKQNWIRELNKRGVKI